MCVCAPCRCAMSGPQPSGCGPHGVVNSAVRALHSTRVHRPAGVTADKGREPPRIHGGYNATHELMFCCSCCTVIRAAPVAPLCLSRKYVATRWRGTAIPRRRSQVFGGQALTNSISVWHGLQVERTRRSTRRRRGCLIQGGAATRGGVARWWRRDTMTHEHEEPQ